MRSETAEAEPSTTVSPSAHLVTVPAVLFNQIVPSIRDEVELRVVLQVAFLGAQGAAWVPAQVLQGHSCLENVLGHDAVDGRERVQAALQAAVEHGILRQRREAGSTAYALSLARIDWTPTVPLSEGSRNVFRLHERYLGPLTAAVAEDLRSAERMYPLAWLEAAMDEAARSQNRSWRYVQVILKSWEERGGPDGTTRRHH